MFDTLAPRIRHCNKAGEIAVLCWWLWWHPHGNVLLVSLYVFISVHDLWMMIIHGMLKLTGSSVFLFWVVMQWEPIRNTNSLVSGGTNMILSFQTGQCFMLCPPDPPGFSPHRAVTMTPHLSAGTNPEMSNNAPAKDSSPPTHWSRGPRQVLFLPETRNQENEEGWNIMTRPSTLQLHILVEP